MVNIAFLMIFAVFDPSPLTVRRRYKLQFFTFIRSSIFLFKIDKDNIFILYFQDTSCKYF